MNERVIDLRQRQQAIAPGESFIVQAPAGSGKTELLMQRYLRLLAVVEEPEEIIAITFTRKAAGEMRGRIINALQRVNEADTPDDEAAQQTRVLAGAAMQRNRQRGWQLEDNPGRLRIQTIDSLCGVLTRQMPILSGFGSRPEILEQPAELYQQAAANTLELLESGAGWSDAIAVLLGHLDNDLPRARDMLAGMLARRDQWLRHLDVSGSGQRRELEAGLAHAVASTLELARQAFPPAMAEELAALASFAAANLEREGRDSPLRACQGITGLPGVNADDLPGWQAIAGLLLTNDGGWRQRITVAEGFPPAGRGQPGVNQAMKDRLQALIGQLAGDEDLHRWLLAVRRLPGARYSDAEWQVIQALWELLSLSLAQLRLLFVETNRIDFSGITLAAIQALGEEQAPTDLALHLDYRIRHILVDEFQDISSNQYDLLCGLTAGWAPGDGHSLFLVGDPMQSIYRFREAQVGLFLGCWGQRRLGQVPLTPLRLEVNFRSSAGIVDWVNRSFARILPETAAAGRGAVNHSPAVAFHDQADAAAVCVHPLISDNHRAEAGVVLRQIRAAREADPHGRIAVLVRGRTHLQDILPVIRQAGIRFRAMEIDPLGAQPCIQDLLALVRALHHFADRVAWLAILRAPWCGLTLADLLRLAGGERTASIWDCLRDVDKLSALSPDGRQRLARLTGVLQAAFENRQRRDLRGWVEAVWVQIGGPATLETATDLENAQAFFDLLQQFDAGGDLRDREGFITGVQELHAAPDVNADDSLQVMTIHKAKGLEFDTVILPGLGRAPRRDDSPLLLWSENPHREHRDLLLAPIKPTGAENSPIYDFLKDLENEKQFLETGRLLYVAATRARKRLHLVGTVKARDEDAAAAQLRPPGRDTLLMQLWPLVEGEFQAALERQSRAQEPVTPAGPEAGPRLSRLYSDWQPPPPPPSIQWQGVPVLEAAPAPAIEYEWAGESIKHIGTVVHAGIQWLAEEGLEQWDENRILACQGYYRTALIRLGVPAAELDDAVATVTTALHGVLGSEQGRWLFDPGHTDAQNEYPVSGMHDGRLINVYVDRTFIDAQGVRWIVDYKASSHEGGDMESFLDREKERYRSQLEGYGTLFSRMERRPVKLALFFPLLQGWRAWDMPV